MKYLYKLFFILSFNLFEIKNSDAFFSSLGGLFKENMGKVVGGVSFLVALVSIESKNRTKDKNKKKCDSFNAVLIGFCACGLVAAIREIIEA